MADRVAATIAKVHADEERLRRAVLTATEEWQPVKRRLDWLERHAVNCDECLPTIGTDAEGMAHK